MHSAEALKGRSCSVGPGGYPSLRDELLDAIMCVVHIVVCLFARSHVDTTSTITDCTQVKVRFDFNLSGAVTVKRTIFLCLTSESLVVTYSSEEPKQCLSCCLYPED